MKRNEYAREIANTILRQLLATTERSVVFSWGIHGVGYGYVSMTPEAKNPCLIFKVSGLLHTGIVCIAYNEGADTYSIAKMDSDGQPIGDWLHDVYFDEMGGKIDAMVEKDPALSDEAYYRLAMDDSDKKCGF